MSLMKSDRQDLVGKHCFEVAGLGVAPFRLLRFTTVKFQASPDQPARPGTSCDYCSTAIMYVCIIGDSTGKEFKVGCDCVNKTGDAGLIRAYKTSPSYRAHQRSLRQAKDDVVTALLTDLLADDSFRSRLASLPATSKTGVVTDQLTLAERSLPWCGAKGRAEWLAVFRKVQQGKL